MIAYNFGTRLWEWAHLDFYDVMMAQRARLSSSKFKDFYARAVRLAAMDPVLPLSDSPLEHTIESALFAVLLDWYPREEVSAKDVMKRFNERSDRIKELQDRLSNELTAAYSGSHRRYHTRAHVEHCLNELNRSWMHAIHLSEVRWAILFHDAVYDPKRQDNEARSADWACSVMEEMHRPKEEQDRVRAMILATAPAGEPRTPDEALLQDVDLSVLGAEETVFDEYDRAIRAEYEWAPEESYLQARAELLESFLARARLYRTAPFRERYEASARKNLRRALIMSKM
jgi:predicted metal-dependent HD superfamily phosphohydrolase